MSSEFKELLLEDYRYRSESMWRNEAGGETRVNLFIGLITLGGGGAGALASKDSNLHLETVRFLVVAALVSLLVLGLVTLVRIVKRNQNTDLAKFQLDMVRQTFKDHFDDTGALDHYELFPVNPAGKSRIKPRKRGGLTDTVAAMNGLLCGGVVCTLLFPPFTTLPHLAIALVALLVAAAASVGQCIFVQRRETRSHQELEEKFAAPSHAGGVVYAMQNGMPQYLLVSPKDGSSKWLLPKGHIKRDHGESAREAALREVHEEAGIVVRPGGAVGRVQFDAGTRVDAVFYLMEKLAEAPRQDVARRHEWFPFDRALKELEYDESKRLLHKAELLRLQNAEQPVSS